MTYTNNGMLATLLDGENNLTTTEYDGFDRPSKTRYPSPTKGSGTSSTTDYEQLTYDANSNVTSRRLRDGNSIGFTYDNLNRATLKDLPGTEPDVSYAYDNLNRPTSASQTGNSLSFTWDALSRRLTEAGPQGSATSIYDLANRRTQLTYPGSGLYVNTDYLVTGEVTAVRENGATSGVGVLATYAFDNLGNRTSVTFGNGASQAFAYDPVSRLASLTNDLSGTTNDLSVTLAYSPASQITQTVRTGDIYAWTGHGNGSTSFTSNGLNQQVSIGGSSATWDSKGNLTTEPQSGKTYGYSSENLLTSASGGVTLAYDPAMRLYQVAGGITTRFAYDGLNVIAEYDGSNALQRRFVFDGLGQPVVWYEGSGTTDRRFMSADERGSVISLTDSAGALIGINRYDEYGKPQSTNLGRFGYTGQKWLPETSAYHFPFRDLVAQHGIFAQTDPIGYKDSPNLYAYVRNDPVNYVDPLGLECNPAQNAGDCSPIFITGPSGIGSAGAGPGGLASRPGIGNYRGTFPPLKLPKTGPLPKKPTCPTGELGRIRHDARTVAKWSGTAGGVLGIAGAVPTPATPALESGAATLIGLSRLSTVVAIGTDVAYGFQSGNWNVALDDIIEAGVGEVPLGSAMAGAGRLARTPASSSAANKVAERFGNAAVSADVAFLWPKSCE